MTVLKLKQDIYEYYFNSFFFKNIKQTLYIVHRYTWPIYLWCISFCPANTRPISGGVLSIVRPSDDATEQRPAVLHASTRIKYLFPGMNGIIQVKSVTNLNN